MIWKPLKKIDNYELRDGYFLSESGDIINQKKKIITHIKYNIEKMGTVLFYYN